MTQGSITVMVTGVGGGGHGDEILKALRLSSLRYEIIGGDMSPLSRGLKVVDRPYLLPPASDAGYLRAVLAACRKHGAKVLFHGSEPELRVMSRERQVILDAGLLLPINPARVIDTCMDKVLTQEFLASQGIPVPAFRKVRTVEEAMEFGQLPAVLKPSLGGGGSMNVYLVQTRDELAACAAQLLHVAEEFIVQAYVGRPEDEYTVGVLTDLDGNFVNSIAVRRNLSSALSNRMRVKNRTARAELGPVLAISSGVSQGEIGRFPEVTGPCERIATALGSRGPINIQCRMVDGVVYVFEINARFSGTTSLRALVGYNEPDVLVRRHLLGESIPTRFPYRSGVIMRSLAETFIERIDFPRASEL